MRAEIIAIGDELVTGQRLDTNSRWLAAELGVLGIDVACHLTVADTLEAGVEAFRAAADRARLVVATGGLGPTADDLTRDVLAALAGVPLDLSADALAAVEARFASRNAPMPDSNRRQALFPRGSRIIDNPDGTAPGIDLNVRGASGACRIFALPGVPAEMRTMWEATVAPAILAMQPESATVVQRRIKCFGAGESAIEAMVPGLIARGRDPLVGITAHEATITLRIAAHGANRAACEEKISPTEASIRDRLGLLVYGVEDDELEDATLAAVAESGATLATVEMATEGRVAALLAQATTRRGARGQASFAGGVVLPEDVGHDAAALAARARQEYGSALGLGVGATRSGPDGRPVIDIVLESAGETSRIVHVLGGGPALARVRTAKAALDLVRRTLLAGESPAARAQGVSR
jgi:nicotinamide-nucleotide amidase